MVCGSEGAECVRVGGGGKLTKDDFYVVSSFFSDTVGDASLTTPSPS